MCAHTMNVFINGALTKPENQTYTIKLCDDNRKWYPAMCLINKNATVELTFPNDEDIITPLKKT